MRRTYLDYNASAPVRPEVRQAVWETLSLTGNPSSVHLHGQRCHRQLDLAREQVAALVGSHPDQVIFTSGGTEANHLALRGLPARAQLVSAIEHDSVLAAADESADASVSSPEDKFWDLSQRVPVSREGIIDLDALEWMLQAASSNTYARTAGRAEPILLSVMLVNNETGVIQPFAAITEIARRFRCWIHCDAVQAAGRIGIDIDELDVDCLTLSAHKLGGLKGSGALIVRHGLPLRPLISGGGQEHKYRAGTENLPGIIGFGRAAQVSLAELDRQSGITRLREQLEAGVKTMTPEAVIAGAAKERIAGTSCIINPRWPSDFQVMALDLAGVAVSAGAACSSGVVKPSHVLEAMGFDARSASSAIRVSLGWDSKQENITHFLSAWSTLCLSALCSGAIGGSNSNELKSPAALEKISN